MIKKLGIKLFADDVKLLVNPLSKINSKRSVTGRWKTGLTT